MSGPPPFPIEQHNLEIQKNRAAWDRKPQLREIYLDFQRRIAEQLNRSIPGLIVELGSGMGTIKEVIPDCITTDLFANPWLDRQENAYQLSFADGSVSNLILFDVWHHLRYPGTALKEFRRVLAPGGRIILFEPAASLTGRFVYSVFHHEPVALNEPAAWEAPAGFSAKDADYYAAQGSATRLFWWGEGRERLGDWRVVSVTPIASFEYFASGGFSGPQIPLRILYRALRSLDRVASTLPNFFAARLLVVLEHPRG